MKSDNRGKGNGASTPSKPSSGSQSQNVRVVCRVRPPNQKEISMGGIVCVKHNDSNIEIAQDEGMQTFSVDRIFGADSTQESVFDYSAKPLISDVLSGYNATIFAYGQTGTGKTYTMEGDIRSETQKGIIPRVVEALFDGVSEADENIEFTFKVSYVEIYLEKIRDLLDENKIKTNLTIREDKIKGIYIAGVTEEYVTSQEELLGIMSVGALNRATAATGMNEGSSRSHSVFTITVGQKDIITNATKSGKLVLVDLAGSEMVRKTNASGQQLEEAKTINKSLSALGQVINALTDEKQSHVPYRDSKLTRVLQDSLGGNSKTVLIVAISPSSYNASESVSTLRFGTRAKKIENKVTVNQTRSIEELEGLLLRAEKAIDTQTAHIISLSAQLQQALMMVQHGQGMGAQESEETEKEKEAIAAAEAARSKMEQMAFSTLQDTVSSLTQELDEERQESNRKDSELRQLTVLLKDKERLIQDATAMLSEVQRSNESIRERSEQLLEEKIKAVGELESLRAQLDDEENKAKFNMMEIEVSLATLKTENEQLKIELAEMSGDAAEGNANTSTVKKGQKSKNVISSASSMVDDVDVVELRKKLQESSVKSGVLTAEEGERLLSSQDRKDILDKYSNLFASTCLRLQVNEENSAELFSVFLAYSNDQEKGISALEDKFISLEKSSSRRVRELEDQRSRIERDLQTRIENMIQLQIKFDSLSRMDNRQYNDTLAEKDKEHLKSLQQRLEQLVAVHRQLLRKFASLELENGELKKKSQLRDERIRQLEGNAKGLIGNIRHQAERHVAELTALREQIQVLKSEHEQRVETFKLQQIHDGNPIISPRINNRSGALQPKSLRGGGGTKSFYGELPPGALPISPNPTAIMGGSGNKAMQSPTSNMSSSMGGLTNSQKSSGASSFISMFRSK